MSSNLAEGIYAGVVKLADTELLKSFAILIRRAGSSPVTRIYRRLYMSMRKALAYQRVGGKCLKSTGGLAAKMSR